MNSTRALWSQACSFKGCCHVKQRVSVKSRHSGPLVTGWSLADWAWLGVAWLQDSSRHLQIHGDIYSVNTRNTPWTIIRACTVRMSWLWFDYLWIESLDIYIYTYIYYICIYLYNFVLLLRIIIIIIVYYIYIYTTSTWRMMSMNCGSNHLSSRVSGLDP